MDIEASIDDAAEIDMARRALAELDHVLAQRPAADGHALARAVAQLCRWRNLLAMRLRRDGNDAAIRLRLEHVNAHVSLVLAARFPLGGIPWQELENSRAWLDSLAEALPNDG